MDIENVTVDTTHDYGTSEETPAKLTQADEENFIDGLEFGGTITDEDYADTNGNLDDILATPDEPDEPVVPDGEPAEPDGAPAARRCRTGGPPGRPPLRTTSRTCPTRRPAAGPPRPWWPAGTAPSW